MQIPDLIVNNSSVNVIPKSKKKNGSLIQRQSRIRFGNLNSFRVLGHQCVLTFTSH